VTAGARVPKYKGFSATRPPDIAEDHWQAAMRGLQQFVAGGWADQAEAAGWTRNELYRAPELWVRADLCGAALLIGANEVIAVTPTEIRIKTASGATQVLRKRSLLDLGRIYDERFKLIAGNVGPGEARLRAREAAVREYQRSHNANLADATRAVDAIIAAKEAR
jgi:hypothetical protein